MGEGGRGQRGDDGAGDTFLYADAIDIKSFVKLFVKLSKCFMLLYTTTEIRIIIGKWF